MRTNSRQTEAAQPKPARARAVIEFIEWDLSRPPIVYPAGNGSDEQDETLRREILKRWGARG